MLILILFSIGIIGGILYFFYGKKSSRSGVLGNYGHLPVAYLFFLRIKQKPSELKTINNEGNDIDSEYQSDNSSVIVTLLGNEYSPENLTELGTSLSLDKKIKVVNITEVPDQTSLDVLQQKLPK